MALRALALPDKSRMNVCRAFAHGYLLIAILGVAAGCSESSELSSPAARRLQVLATVYLDYAVAKGAGPANRQQLQAHFQNAPPFILSAEGVSAKNSHTVFTSLRDGEPFVISYGVGFAFRDDVPIIACERVGKDGMRLAAYANGKIGLVDQRAVQELLPDT
jgi:hypothetical protein